MFKVWSKAFGNFGIEAGFDLHTWGIEAKVDVEVKPFYLVVNLHFGPFFAVLTYDHYIPMAIEMLMPIPEAMKGLVDAK